MMADGHQLVQYIRGYDRKERFVVCAHAGYANNMSTNNDLVAASVSVDVLIPFEAAGFFFSNKQFVLRSGLR